MNAEAVSAYNRAYYESHRAAMIASSHAYYQAHKAETAAQSRAYRESHKAEVAARRSAYYREHKVEAAAASRARYKAHKAELDAYHRAYQKEHPEKRREVAAVRRAQKMAALAEKVEVAVLAERDHDRCGICQRSVAVPDRSIDHILPLSRGGAHTYANTRLTHRLCNVRRQHRGEAQLRMVG